VWPLHSQFSLFSKASLGLGKGRRHREPNLGCRGLTDLGDVMLCQKKSLHENCRMGRHIVVMKLICSLCHCEWDGHTVHELSQRRLTTDWLAPRESDYLRMRSNVSSDWLPSYDRATSNGSEDIKNVRIVSVSSFIDKLLWNISRNITGWNRSTGRKTWPITCLSPPAQQKVGWDWNPVSLVIDPWLIDRNFEICLYRKRFVLLS